MVMWGKIRSQVFFSTQTRPAAFWLQLTCTVIAVPLVHLYRLLPPPPTWAGLRCSVDAWGGCGNLLDRPRADGTDTGNSCKHPGYDEFEPPSWPSACAPNKDDWIALDLPVCGEGDAYPEEFWNCADVTIFPGG